MSGRFASQGTGGFHRVAAGLGALLLAFLALPVLALVLRSLDASLLAGLEHPLVWPAIRLSLGTTAVTAVLVTVTGTALAWWMAQSQSPRVRALETAVQLPVVVPPAVAGVAMLLAFGREGLLGPLLRAAGVDLAFTTGAVVLAQVFVSAPFFLQAATQAFRQVDPALLAVARSLGARPARVFFRVALPLALPGIAGGVAMAWARALGEFGATLMFAGSLSGRTQTLPLAVYAAMETDLEAAQSMSVLMVLVALTVLVTLRLLTRSAARKATSFSTQTGPG